MEDQRTPQEGHISSGDGIAQPSGNVHDADPPGSMHPRSSVGEKSAGKVYDKHYRGTSALLVLFIIMLAVGLRLYPNRQAVYRPPPFQLEFTFHNLLYQNVTISAGKEAPDQYYLDVSVPAPSPQSVAYTKYGSSVFWILEVPAKVAASCGTCTVDSPRGAVYSEIDDAPVPKQIDGSWYFERKYILQTSSFAWNENGLNIEAQLPIVQVNSTRTASFLVVYNGYLKHLGDGPERLAVETSNINVAYYVPNARTYDWVGGPQPNFAYVTGQDMPAVWDQSASAMAESVAVSGINNSAADWDNTRTLAAGVLFGIAGGALIGAIQEANQVEWGRSRFRKGKPTRSA